MKAFLAALLLSFCFVAALASSNAPYEEASHNLNPNPVLIETSNITERTYWPMFKQCDSRWGSHQLGTCSLSICSAGCAMSSVSMLLASRGWSGNPSTLNDWLRSHGGYAGGCNIYWGAPDRLGYTHFMGFETPTYSEVCSGVSRGHGVLINVRHGSHWVLVTGCAGNGVFHVNDPGFSQSTYHTSDVSRYAVYH